MACNIIEVGGVINNSFTRNKYCFKSELNKKIEQFTGDKYMTIYSYESEDVNTCKFIAPLYLDFDIDNLEENYDKLIRDLKIIVYRLKTELHLEDKDIKGLINQLQPIPILEVLSDLWNILQFNFLEKSQIKNNSFALSFIACLK